VKEQSWINETLNMHQWNPVWQQPAFGPESDALDSIDPEEEFEALLNSVFDDV
jgi:hypothetical protein